MMMENSIALSQSSALYHCYHTLHTYIIKQQRMFGGQKLWNSKDEHAWVHDRFEEMNLQDPHRDEERQRSKDRFRGQGSSRIHGTGDGYFRGRSRSHIYYNDGKGQNRALKTVRGRGPRHYEPLAKINPKILAAKRKHMLRSTKSQEPTSNPNAEKQPSQIQNTQPEPVLPRKNTFASSLNSASRPFFPSESSNQELSVDQRRVAQSRNTNRALSPSVQLHDSLQRGKAIVDSVCHSSLYVDDSLRPAGVKNMAGSPLYSSAFTLSSISGGQSFSNLRVQGRGVSIGGSPNSKALQSQDPIVQQRPVQPPIQHASRKSAQQFSQRSNGGNHVSSPTKPLSTSLAEDEEADPLTGSDKSKTRLERGNLATKELDGVLSYTVELRLLVIKDSLELQPSCQLCTLVVSVMVFLLLVWPCQDMSLNLSLVLANLK